MWDHGGGRETGEQTEGVQLRTAKGGPKKEIHQAFRKNENSGGTSFYSAFRSISSAWDPRSSQIRNERGTWLGENAFPEGRKRETSTQGEPNNLKFLERGKKKFRAILSKRKKELTHDGLTIKARGGGGRRGLLKGEERLKRKPLIPSLKSLTRKARVAALVV